jgi:hypothetical protein
MVRLIVLTVVAASIFGLAELFFGASAVYAAHATPAGMDAPVLAGWIVAA